MVYFRCITPVADVLVGIALTIFCVVTTVTVLRGKLPVGTERFGSRHGETKKLEGMDEKKKQDLEHTHMEDLPAGVRWISLLGKWVIHQKMERGNSGCTNSFGGCGCFSINTNSWQPGSFCSTCPWIYFPTNSITAFNVAH